MSSSSIKNSQQPLFNDDWGFDEASFERFFKALYPRLCIYCKLKFEFDIHQSEDIVNTAFIKLWQARQTVTTGISARSYLYKVIDNSSINILKHQKVVDAHAKYLVSFASTEGVFQSSFDSLDLKQLRMAIDSAIAELPEQMRRIFEFSRFEGLKYAEIASELNISVKTVETQMSRALVKLREKLSRYLMIVIVMILRAFMKI